MHVVVSICTTVPTQTWVEETGYIVHIFNMQHESS